MFTYRATLVKVVDGDTIDIDIDLGFRLTTRQRCRLAGVNCPETKGATKAAGNAATAYTAAWFQGPGLVPVVFRVASKKPYADDKYGRFLVTVCADGKAESLNTSLLRAGHAVPFMGDET